MKKAVGIAAGIVVVVAAVAATGAWYTGTQLEPVLADAVRQANQEMATSLTGADGQPVAKVELVSLQRHFFSSVAQYRVTLQGAELGGEKGTRALLLQDRIEHGPLPMSRLKRLDLMPVMAASHFSLQNSPDTAAWFAMSNGQTPLTGTATIGYDRSSDTALTLSPLQFQDDTGSVSFSGLTARATLSGDAQKYSLTGASQSLVADIKGEQGSARFQFQGLSFDMGGTKGASGFYLGHNDAKVAEAILGLPNLDVLHLRDASSSGLMQEVAGNFAAQLSYDIGMITYADRPVGAAQMAWKFANFDIGASKGLLKLYQDVIAPQLAVEVPEGQVPAVNLSPAEQQQLSSGLATLLDAHPHVELERLTLKTANGESRFNVAADLANPAPLQPGAPGYAQKILGQLDAKLSLSKPMLADLGSLQASAQGLTDPARVAQAGEDLSATVAGLGQMLGLARDEGEQVVSSLSYKDGTVDFNGRKMSAQQFFGMVMGQVGALRQ
ncbi:YdgA family protein [Pseudomonas sp. UBA4194]|uniref:YdgA family protein n=1 Tax=Pseudomonas sp. UBA4194 TaxID=1947317 RepID=UPI0025F5524C|nr:YdgA family protein [Pseudomonas sp. UBA4194]